WTGEEPRLVRLEDPDRDVSSQHLEVRVEGDQVWVRDLGSTNGTDVVVPGAEPVALRTGELRPIVPGTRIILAGTFTVMHEAGDADQP
ncbi:MAG: FHA domain-containing protein, partial [Propionibacteriaceae bacterium]|nr:FHA domain-containing protein [Propionibacteriaceae bacterium]